MGISQHLERKITTGPRWNVSSEAFLSCAAVNPPGWDPRDRVPFLKAMALKTRSVKSFLTSQAATHCMWAGQESRSAASLTSLSECPHAATRRSPYIFYSLYIICNGFCDLFIFPVKAIPTQTSWQALHEPSAICCTCLVYTNNYKFALSKDYFFFGKTQLKY